MRTRADAAAADGFTLIETMIALAVLATGLLALAQVFALGLAGIAMAGPDLIAREKASEAVESVYTARDARTITWDQIRNEEGESGADGGVFLDGLQPVAAAGPDGLINTADDGVVETIVMPGGDGDLGTADDQVQPLEQFQREIEIRDVAPNLRRIRVTIQYVGAGGRRQYVLETLVAAFA